MNTYFSRNNILIALFFIGAASLGRIALWDIPNVETILVFSLLAGFLLRGPWMIVVGLVSVALTDMIMGNTVILIYTWSAWALMGLFGFIISGRFKSPLQSSLALTGMGIMGTLFFYLWTNFGVWQLSGMYAHTIEGLLQSYYQGLPFLRMHLVSTLIFVPTISFAVLTVYAKKRSLFSASKSPQLVPVTQSYEKRS